MAPRRKAATRSRSAAADQSTLSFGNQSRITKPTTAPTAGKKSKDELDTADVVFEDFKTPEVEEPTTAEVVIREQVKHEVEHPKDAVEVEAQAIGEAQLKRYWKDREAERKAPRGMI